MATEKILNTRIQLKYDTLANWNSSTFIPKKGEMCIATVTTATKDSKGNIIHVPTVLVKVGDNENVFSALPFVSAPAADVYDWAKKDEATFVANFLSMKNGDQTMQSLLDGIFATPAEVETAIATFKTNIIDGIISRLGTAEGKITTLEGKVATLEASGYDDTEVRGLITGNTNAINAIKDSTTLDSFKDVEDALAGKQAAGDYATNTALNAVKATAEAAYVKPVAGISKSDLAADVQTSLGKADTALQSHQDISHLATKTEVQAGDKANSDAIGAINTTLGTYGDIVTHNVAEFATAAQGAKADTALQEHQDISHLAEKTAVEGIAGRVTTAEGKITALEGKVDVAKVSEAISTAVAGEAARADAAEKKVLEDAKKYTDEEIDKIVTGSGYATTKYVDEAVAGHETAVNTKFESYSTTEQMNNAIDADVLVETNRAMAAEKANADAIAAITDSETIKSFSDVDGVILGIYDSETGILAQANEYTNTQDQAIRDELVAGTIVVGKAATVGGYSAQDLKDYADSLADNYDAAGSAEDALEAAKAYTDEVKAGILGEGITETFDTLKEIENWINAQGGSTVELTKAIADEAKAREDADKAINDTIATLATKEELAAETKAREDADKAVNETIAKIIGGIDNIEDNSLAELRGDITSLNETIDGFNYVDKEEFNSAIENCVGSETFDSTITSITGGAGGETTLASLQDAINSITSEESGILTQAKDYTDELANGAVKANTEAIAAINNTENGILAQAKAYADSLNHEDTKYTAAADGGLKLNADNSFAIDDSLVFVFDCGDASTKIN